MKNNENERAFINALRKYFSMFAVLAVALVFNAACEKDMEMPKENPQQQQNPGGQTPQDTTGTQDTTDTQGNALDPNTISEHLVFRNGATKIMGSLPQAQDGQIQIDVKDTIFVAKGFPLGDRIRFKDPAGPTSKAGNVSGIYVGIPGADWHYEVLVESNEGPVLLDPSDSSIDVPDFAVTLDLDLTDLGEIIAYDFSTDIIIQPHDGAGTPLDEFERTITIEDPENSSCNDIRESVVPLWAWDYTIRVINGGEDGVTAPGQVHYGDDTAAGCCDPDTGSSVWISDLTCDDRLPTYVELPQNTYDVPTFYILQLNEDGNAQIASQYVTNNVNLRDTNFCDGEVTYMFKDDQDGHRGTHDFSPGNTTLTLEGFPIFSGFGRPPRFSEIEYTCHWLMLTYTDGEGGNEWSIVFSHFDQAGNVTDFRDQWFD